MQGGGAGAILSFLLYATIQPHPIVPGAQNQVLTIQDCETSERVKSLIKNQACKNSKASDNCVGLTSSYSREGLRWGYSGKPKRGEITAQ